MMSPRDGAPMPSFSAEAVNTLALHTDWVDSYASRSPPPHPCSGVNRRCATRSSLVSRDKHSMPIARLCRSAGDDDRPTAEWGAADRRPK
jgi:hypothetical protein